MKTKLPAGWHRHEITSIQEEGACGECGFPIEVGEAAYFNEAGKMACSVACARELERRAAKPVRERLFALSDIEIACAMGENWG